MKVLLVEDDRRIREVLEEILRMEGHATLGVESGERALESIKDFAPDILILDYNLPGKDGLQVLKSLKEDPALESIPVIMLTGESGQETMISAYDLGVEDFVTKPFIPTILLKKVRSVGSRTATSHKPQRTNWGQGFSLDFDLMKIQVRGTEVPVTHTEFKIMAELCALKGTVLHRKELQRRVFGSANVGKRTLDVHMCSLRKKLKNFGLGIETVRGLGYRLSQADPDALKEPSTSL